MRHQITNFIPAISIFYFLNDFCIFFTCIISVNIICSCFFLFSFNSCHSYLTIILFLLVSDIIILNKFTQLIQVFFAAPGSSLRASILHIFCKRTPIFHNNTSIYCIKLQALLFYTKLLFFMGHAINIFVYSNEQIEPISIYSN